MSDRRSISLTTTQLVLWYLMTTEASLSSLICMPQTRGWFCSCACIPAPLFRRAAVSHAASRWGLDPPSHSLLLMMFMMATPPLPYWSRVSPSQCPSSISRWQSGIYLWMEYSRHVCRRHSPYPSRPSAAVHRATYTCLALCLDSMTPTPTPESAATTRAIDPPAYMPQPPVYVIDVHECCVHPLFLFHFAQQLLQDK